MIRNVLIFIQISSSAEAKEPIAAGRQHRTVGDCAEEPRRLLLRRWTLRRRAAAVQGTARGLSMSQRRVELGGRAQNDRRSPRESRKLRRSTRPSKSLSWYGDS